MNKQIVATVFAGFLTVGIAFSIRYAYGMLLPEMLTSLNISKTQAGVIFASYFLMYTVCTPAMGVLSDLFSYRAMMVVFTAILGLGAILMSFANGYLQASIFISIAGFGHAACWAPVVTLVQKWAPDGKRGTALAIVSTGVGTGIFFWGLLIPGIVSGSGWRSGWFALGATAIGISLLNFILVRNPSSSKSGTLSTRPSVAEFLASYKHIFRQSSFWIIGIAYLLVGYNVIILFTFLPVYARESLMLPYATSTRFISVIALFGIGGQLLLGPLSDKVGRSRIMIVCGLVLGTAGLGLLHFNSVWALYILTAYYGICYGAVWPLYAAVASDLFTWKNTGGIIGLWTLFLGVGSMIAPVVSGWIIDQTGSFDGVFISALITGVLSSLLLLKLPKPAN